MYDTTHHRSLSLCDMSLIPIYIEVTKVSISLIGRMFRPFAKEVACASVYSIGHSGVS